MASVMSESLPIKVNIARGPRRRQILQLGLIMSFLRITPKANKLNGGTIVLGVSDGFWLQGIVPTTRTIKAFGSVITKRRYRMEIV